MIKSLLTQQSAGLSLLVGSCLFDPVSRNRQTQKVVRTRSAAISAQSPVSPVRMGFSCHESAAQWGQQIIVLDYRAPSSRQVEGECCGFGTACSLLAGRLEPFKHMSPRLSTFVSHINSSVYLPCQLYFMRVPTVMAGFRRKLSSVVGVLEK